VYFTEITASSCGLNAVKIVNLFLSQNSILTIPFENPADITLDLLT